MNLRADVTGYLWLVVGLVLTGSGIRLMLVRELYGRVHIADQAPLMDGWPVFGMGLAELVVGLIVLRWAWRNLRGH